MNPPRRPSRFTRSQRMGIVNGILVVIALIVMLQIWLFTATMNAFLGGDDRVLLPAALSSLACFALIAGLIRYLNRLDR